MKQWWRETLARLLGAPIVMLLISIATVQIGSSIAKDLYSAAAPLTVAWLRLGAAAVILGLVTRPRLTAAVDHLVRAGRLEAKILTVGCPAGGCGGCALASSEGAPACTPEAAVPGRRGLVALSLRADAVR